MNATINVAVVGTGYWGQNHVKVYKRLDTQGILRFKKICDANSAISKKIADQYGVASTQSFDEILNDPEIDAVSLCTPNDTHYKLGFEILKAGKNVLIEKPLALSSEEAETLAKIADAQNLVLMPGHIFRFNPLVRKIKEEISKGVIGEPYSLDARRTCLLVPKSECGVILDLAIHDIDIDLYLFDETLPRRVHAIGASPLRNRFEETAFISLDFDGVTSQIFSSWLFPNKLREAWIMGSKGTSYVDFVSERMLMFERRIAANAQSKLEIRDGPCKEVNVERKESLELELTHFVSCVRDNKKPEVDGHIAANVVKVCEAALQSLRNHSTVVVK